LAQAHRDQVASEITTDGNWNVDGTHRSMF
jgi:hypothetical protein